MARAYLKFFTITTVTANVLVANIGNGDAPGCDLAVFASTTRFNIKEKLAFESTNMQVKKAPALKKGQEAWVEATFADLSFDEGW